MADPEEQTPPAVETRPKPQERVPTVRPEYDVIKKGRDKTAPRPVKQDE